jgi:hypothetical protein
MQYSGVANDVFIRSPTSNFLDGNISNENKLTYKKIAVRIFQGNPTISIDVVNMDKHSDCLFLALIFWSNILFYH